MRSRRATCAACGDDDKRIESLSEVDYVQFCGGPRPDWEKLGMEGADEDTRITAKVRRDVSLENSRHIMTSYLHSRSLRRG